MRFVRAKIKEYHRGVWYRVYVTDMLQGITEKFDMETQNRWYDIAYSDQIPSIEDERQKALNALARG